MSILHVQWTVKPIILPQPRLRCGGCGDVRAFKCSGKTRLNANGRKLDAWLIYRCIMCHNTWNRPIFERRHVTDIDPDVMEALHRNDAAWIAAFAFDVADLRRHAGQIEEFPDVWVRKAVLAPAPANWLHLRISIVLERPVCLRLDRLLSAELQISRSRLRGFEDRRRLRMAAGGAAPLRKVLHRDICVEIDLAAEAHREAIDWAARIGDCG